MVAETTASPVPLSGAGSLWLFVEGGDQLPRLLPQQPAAFSISTMAPRRSSGLVARLTGGVRYVGLDGGVEHPLAQLHRRDHVLQELAGRDYRAPVASGSPS